MKIDVIQALVRRLENTGITECEYQVGDVTLVLKFAASANGVATAQAAQALLQDDTQVVVTAPRAGYFHAAHPLENTVLAAPGDAVGKGQTLGFIAIGELLEPVIAPTKGTLIEQQILDGTLVGYGTPLFHLKVPSR
ncbi:hypothetical protein V9L16_15025 [Pseudomonas tolaasii]|uniref:acetyl-CoA carboxylase biotin carboxyl carrier protein n=1 Tax=Pseudomonas tolaasii TaxID=29442 RepID=UPI0030D31929